MNVFNEQRDYSTLEDKLVMRVQIALSVRTKLTESPPATAAGRRALRQTELVLASCMAKLATLSDESQNTVAAALVPNNGRAKAKVRAAEPEAELQEV
jgi:hypothetical protein